MLEYFYEFGYSIDYSFDKNERLKKERGISFEEVAFIILIGKARVSKHHNHELYPHQVILFVEIEGYVYAIPSVVDHKKKTVFLKTIYPTRKMTKLFKKESKQHVQRVSE